MSGRRACVLVLMVCVCVVPVTCGRAAEDEVAEQEAAETRPYGIDVRVPWTGSRVIGSPEPPLPYINSPVLTGISWNQPIFIDREPGTRFLIAIQRSGEGNRSSEIVRLEDAPDVKETRPVLSMPDRLTYAVAFHPEYEQNGFLYVCSNGPGTDWERGNQVMRYTMSRDPNAEQLCDPESGLLIIEWESIGHDGGGLVFGHDGMLYVTTGDGTGDSDQWLSAQDVTNLLGGVIRIDVNRPEDERAYSIPADNPFLEIPGARGELWALGLRNPWRMSIDQQTGQIWIGNNGQDLWETAHLLRRGENYGWSVYEGSHVFYAHREIGPGTVVPPTFEHHHTEARSLTGGVVYDGELLPDLQGAYIYGDYSTGKIWAGRHDGTKVTFHEEIADTTLQLVGFANTYGGELLAIDYATGPHRLEPNPALENPDELPEFPRRLSETGLFESVAEHRVAAGVIPYDVISAGWNDGAQAERFIGLPGETQITCNKSGSWEFPEGAVLVETLSQSPTNSVSADAVETASQRVETRLLTKQQGEWVGYSYEWNEAQDEATLVPAAGKDIQLTGPDGTTQEWRIPARAECMSCHSRAATYVLGCTQLQMDRSFAYRQAEDNQLRTLQHIGVLTGELTPPEERLTLVSPADTGAPLEKRVKAYLHTNCSGCHVAAGGGNARMELKYVTPLDEMVVVSQFPQHATFGLTQPRIIAPGQPDQSVMLARLMRRGRGQMPPLVSRQVDRSAVDLLQEWISSMKPDREFVRDWTVTDLQGDLSGLSEGRSTERGKELFRSVGCGQCHRIEEEIAGIGPNLTGVRQRLKPQQILESIVTPSAQIAEKYAATIIATTAGRVFQGRVQSEDEESIVLTGQNSFAEPQRILKSEIEDRAQSKVSMMPKGTVNHLQRDEILDLLAYVLSVEP